MKIVIVATTYPRGMGYMGTMLPKYLARLGSEVHYITTNLPHYYQSGSSATSYSDFEGGAVAVPGTMEQIDGYTVHTLEHQYLAGQPRILGLGKLLSRLQPEVVQVFGCNGWLPMDAARYKRLGGYRLYTAAHTTHSVFPLATTRHHRLHPAMIRNLLGRQIPGYLMNRRVDCCVAATDDCADVAHRFFGVPSEKLIVIPLGVDTELFYPAVSEHAVAARRQLRAQLDVADDECLAIYTGQLTVAKNPLILARAVATMKARGERVKGLFIGGGEQRDAILDCQGCVVLPFMPVTKLGEYYRAADIGVWPTQESTSMLDAAACALPIVVNHTLVARERIDGNGVTYRLNDLDSMVECLTNLRDPARRMALGEVGAQRMLREFSWRKMVERRLELFKKPSLEGLS